MSNRGGSNYLGDVSTTVSGKSCQRWDSLTPHVHSVQGQHLPEGDLSEAGAYCRSAGRDPRGPWCYTTDPQVVWEYCEVPKCAEGKT